MKEEANPPRPSVQPFDWIVIGQTPCVVCNIRPNGDIEVVHNPDKPSNDGAFWDDGKWNFSLGASGYADKYSRLRSFVAQLKQGPHR